MVDLARLSYSRFLDAPARSATLVREYRRATGVAAERRRRMLDAAWRCAERAVADLPFTLADELLAMRLRAVMGPTMVLTHNPPPLGRARVEQLATAATAALFAAEPHPPRPVPAPTAWRPARSRREQILAAARELFETRGFHAVTINDIGAAVGLRGSSIYRHFASKQALVVAAWERESTRFVAGTLDALQRARSAPDALERLAVSVAQLALESHALMRMTYFDLQNRPEFIGVWQAGQAFVAEAWTDVLGEVRGDLSAVEVRFVVDMTLGVIVEAAADLSGDSPWADEIANLALTFATTVHQG